MALLCAALLLVVVVFLWFKKVNGSEMFERCFKNQLVRRFERRSIALYRMNKRC